MAQRRTHVPHPPSHHLHTISWEHHLTHHLAIVWLSFGCFRAQKRGNDGQTIGKWYAKWTVGEGGMEMKGRWGLALCHEHLSRHYVITSKVPEGHHPRGTSLREALRGNLPLRGFCGGLSKGSAGLCGVLRGSWILGIFRGFSGVVTLCLWPSGTVGIKLGGA